VARSHPDKPQLLCWLTCDAVYVDPTSGKHTLLGVFSNLKAPTFPVHHKSMIWFLTLTDVSVGEHNLKISISLPMDEPKKIVERVFHSQSPAHRINLVNEINNLAFETPGNYSIQIEIDDQMLLAIGFPVQS
jgi:hypothetical protein